ncbi:hypothetical protein A2U01_0106059 [Trifolium medium]|uniref:Uncharacterized protein n=1 Tax=Trifolium medium TaxID=97028 RepID=A0A392VCU7_9FABA|nr:hypothetical protein [Trifolium medium]
MDVKKLQFERMIHALKLEEAASEAASVSIDETMSDDAKNDTAGDDYVVADSDDEDEDSDTSGSASV